MFTCTYVNTKYNVALSNLTLLSEFSNGDDGDSTGAIIGGVVGGISGIIFITMLLLIIVWCYYKKYKKDGKLGTYLIYN